MPATPRERHEVPVGRRHVELAGGVVSPRDDRAIGLQAETVANAPRERQEVPVRRRHVELPAIIGAPGHDRAVGLQTETVPATPRERHEVRVRRRHVEFAVIVASPRHDRAVGLQAETVPIAARERHEVRVRRRHVGLAVGVRSPRHDRAARIVGRHKRERTKDIDPPIAERVIHAGSTQIVGALLEKQLDLIRREQRIVRPDQCAQPGRQRAGEAGACPAAIGRIAGVGGGVDVDRGGDQVDRRTERRLAIPPIGLIGAADHDDVVGVAIAPIQISAVVARGPDQQTADRLDVGGRRSVGR